MKDKSLQNEDLLDFNYEFFSSKEKEETEPSSSSSKSLPTNADEHKENVLRENSTLVPLEKIEEVEEVDEDLKFISNKENILENISQNKTVLKLQNIVNSPKSEYYIPILLQNLKGNLSSLILGKYSNYFISDLIKNANKKQKIDIILEIKGQIQELSNNQFGSHPIQTLVETASSKEEICLIISAVSKKQAFFSMSINPYGTFVIQKILTFINENFRNKVNQLILENFVSLSLNTHGACVVKKFIQNCENRQTQFFMCQIAFNNFILLCKNQFGNYVIQDLFKKTLNIPELNIIFRNYITANFIILSLDPFGYFIVDFYLKMISIQEIKMILMNINKCQSSLSLLSSNKLGTNILSKIYQRIKEQNP